MSANVPVRMNNVAYKTIAFIEIVDDGIFLISMWLIISARDIQTGNVQPILL